MSFKVSIRSCRTVNAVLSQVTTSRVSNARCRVGEEEAVVSRADLKVVEASEVDLEVAALEVVVLEGVVLVDVAVDSWRIEGAIKKSWSEM
jgi:hypothetical protein